MMDKETCFNDGISVLEILLNKYLIGYGIPDEETKKYFIACPDDANQAFEVIDKRIVARFPMYFSNDGVNASHIGNIVSLLEDNARMMRFEAVPEEEKNTALVKNVDDLKFENNFDDIASFAEIGHCPAGKYLLHRRIGCAAAAPEGGRGAGGAGSAGGGG